MDIHSSEEPGIAQQERRRRPGSGIAWSVGGALGVLVGLVVVVTSVRSVTSGTDQLLTAGVIALGWLLLVLGTAFLWQGMGLLRGVEGPLARQVFPPAAWLVLAFVLVLAAGAGLLAWNPPTLVPFSIAHFLATALPVSILVAFAARAMGSSRLRDLVSSVGWGGIVVPFLASVGELVGAALLLTAILVVGGFSPGGLLNLLFQGTFSPGAALPNGPLSTPLLILVIGVVVIVAPLVEEALKALVVVFHKPASMQRRDAILWGMAAGGGFAILEGLFNPLQGLLPTQAPTGVSLFPLSLPAAWSASMLVRAGASLIHVTTGAIMGQGWYMADVEHRGGRLLGAYGMSFGLHAAWNGMALLMGDVGTSPLSLGPASWVGIAGLVVLLVFAGIYLARTVARERLSWSGEEVVHD